MYLKRDQHWDLATHIARPPETMALVTGPRSTGKTTLVRQVLSDIGMSNTYATFADSVTWPFHAETDHDLLTRRWNEARAQASRSALGHTLVLDDVQQVPRWTELVQELWDHDRERDTPLRVVLVCTVPLGRQAHLTNHLMGRIKPVRLTHWSLQDMVAAFHIDFPTYLYFGGYPGAAGIVDEAQWREYVLNTASRSIDLDVLAQQRVVKPETLRELFRQGAKASGRKIAHNKLVDDPVIGTATLTRYMTLLDGADLITGLPRRPATAHRQRRASLGNGRVRHMGDGPPRLLAFNTALMTAMSDYTFAEAQADRSFWGRVGESAVASHVLNTSGKASLSCYGKDGADHMYFAIHRDQRVVMVEVNDTVGEDESMRARKESLSNGCSVLIGNHGLSLAEFLSTPVERWFDPELYAER